jgi:hypothetical protein
MELTMHACCCCFASILLMTGCFAESSNPPLEADSCFELPASSAPGVAARQVQGRTLQGNTHQGKTGQGKTGQGTLAQGSEAALRKLNGFTVRMADDAPPLRVDEGRLGAGDAGLFAQPLHAISHNAEPFMLTLTRLEVQGATSSYGIQVDGLPACANGALGLFVNGAWDEQGAHVSDDRAITYACDDGVIAKCVHWGYAPWTVGEELHQSCTRLARADYCGDGASWTREGTEIDVYDTLGIQVPADGSDLSFEAAWGTAGALCASSMRYVVTDSGGDRVLPSCWSSLPACDSLGSARFTGAILANDSAHQMLTACQP